MFDCSAWPDRTSREKRKESEDGSQAYPACTQGCSWLMFSQRKMKWIKWEAKQWKNWDCDPVRFKLSWTGRTALQANRVQDKGEWILFLYHFCSLLNQSQSWRTVFPKETKLSIWICRPFYHLNICCLHSPRFKFKRSIKLYEGSIHLCN